MKSIKTILFSYFIILFCSSCEKSDMPHALYGEWEFSESCNTHLSIGCIKDINLNYQEKISFTNDELLRYFDNSLISAVEFKFKDSLLVYGNNEYAQMYLLQKNSLILIDTCFSCTATTYIRR